MEWKIAEAKSRLSELVAMATREGPQIIRGQDESVIVVSEPAYNALIGQGPTLKELLLNGPSLDGILQGRDPLPAREVSL